MRSPVAHRLIILIVAAILGAHMAELVDRWDDTLKSGRDTESTLTVIAACAGVVFIAAQCVRLLLGARDACCDAAQQPCLLTAMIAETSPPCVSPPPVLPLRI